MSGLGHILGGMISGYGAGMAESARTSLEQRHQMAMEELRSRNTQAETTQRADLDDRNDSRSTTRRTNATLVVNRQQGDIQGETDARRRTYDVEDREDGQAHDRSKWQFDRVTSVSLENVRAANERAAAQLEAQLNSGEVHSLETSADGQVVAIMRDGSRRNTGVIAQQQAAGGGTALQSLGGGPPATSNAPAAQPARAADYVFDPASGRLVPRQ
jgi:hypothetical protein